VLVAFSAYLLIPKCNAAAVLSWISAKGDNPAILAA